MDSRQTYIIGLLIGAFGGFLCSLMLFSHEMTKVRAEHQEQIASQCNAQKNN